MMRLRTDRQAFTTSLAEYLRCCGCVVEVIDQRVIDVAARPESFAAAYADIELDGYLSVWEAMHPEARVERLTPLAVSGHPAARPFATPGMCPPPGIAA